MVFLGGGALMRLNEHTASDSTSFKDPLDPLNTKDASIQGIVQSCAIMLYSHVIYCWKALELTFSMTLFYPAR